MITHTILFSRQPQRHMFGLQVDKDNVGFGFKLVQAVDASTTIK